MLIIHRFVGRRICIGDDVEISVEEIREGEVSIGIVVPPGVTVHCDEADDQATPAAR